MSPTRPDPEPEPSGAFAARRHRGPRRSAARRPRLAAGEHPAAPRPPAAHLLRPARNREDLHRAEAGRAPGRRQRAARAVPPGLHLRGLLRGLPAGRPGGFELKPGPLRKIVDQAKDNPSTPYFLIIDEINRGNLAKIFGELYFLLEYRDRDIDLLYATDDDVGFTLPKNVFIIGTMNTADRSIALVDSAMRRRFAFEALHPSYEPTAGLLRRWLKAEELPEEAADLLDALNARIEDPDFKIGPSYFMKKGGQTAEGIERVWRTAIMPLLEEHHYGDLTATRSRSATDSTVIRARVRRVLLWSADARWKSQPGSLRRRVRAPMHLILTEGEPARLVALTRLAPTRCTPAMSPPSTTPTTRPVDGRAAGKIGVVRVGDLQVTIKPKVEIDRLVFMMGYARNPSYWLDDRVRLDRDLDLPEAWPRRSAGSPHVRSSRGCSRATAPSTTPPPSCAAASARRTRSSAASAG